MNLPVQWNTKLWFILELSSWWWFQRGSKFQILVGVLITNHQSFIPSSRYRRPEIFCMQTCPGVLYKLHMVSRGSVLMMWFAPKKLPKTQRLGVVAEIKVTKIFQLALEMTLAVQWNTKLWFILEGYSLGVLAESEVTKIFQLALGDKSPSPVEH